MHDRKSQSFIYNGNTIEGAIDNNKKGSTRDRAYTQKSMCPILNYLKDHNVENFQSLIQSLHKKNLQKEGQIILLLDLMQNNKKEEISFQKRVLKKSNISERNALLNYYAFKYPYETKLFLEKYIPQKFPNVDDMQNLIQDLKTKIDILSNQSLNFIFSPVFNFIDEIFW